MKISGAIIILLFGCKLSGKSQPILIPENPNWTATLVKELEILENPNKSISLDSILWYPDYFKFGENNLTHDDLKLHYWARCQIKYEGNDDESITFSSKFWDSVTIFIIDSSHHISVLNIGILEGNQQSRFLFQPGQRYDVYLSYDSRGSFRREDNINLVIKKTISLLNNSGSTNYSDGINFGILIGLSFYNLFLFFSIRDKSYLWYFLYIFSVSVLFISLFLDSPSPLVQYFHLSPLLSFYIKKISDPLAWIFLIQFSRSYFNLNITYPRIDKVYKLFAILIIVQFLIGFVGIYHFNGIPRIVVWNAVIFTSTFITILSFRDGNQSSIYLIFGQLFPFVTTFLSIFYYKNIDFVKFISNKPLHDYLFSVNFTLIGQSIEAIFFSFALGGKYNRLQKDIACVKLEKEHEQQALLKEQNENLEQQVLNRTEELSHSLTSLKATQAQLIQSEKMASLGELTAGIAHEIQNPLNFINNFSEINKEILNELNGVQSLNENLNPELKQLFHQVSKNSEIINNHGKRIDSIVKGMLQHSHHGSSIEEPTNINALCEECLKLAFHAYKAKDPRDSSNKSFGVVYETKFDLSLPKINITKQDLNRVILNIINNAFYACANRSLGAVRIGKSESNKQEEYQPKVTVSTRMIPNWVEISILDNGCGIPENIQEKIFQPFFTTKPTGEGTGLGLSMAYDIVTKGMGGKLSVKSEQGEYSEFIISLPNKNKKSELTIAAATTINFGKAMLTLLFLLLFFASNADNTPVIIPKDPAWSVTLIKELEILENPNKSITLDNLMERPEQYPFSKNNLTHDELRSHYWAKFNMLSNSQLEEWITFSSDFWHNASIYIIDSSQKKTILNIGVLEAKQKNQFLLIPGRIYNVYISFDAQSSVKLEENINLKIKKTISTLEWNVYTRYLDGIVLGIMFGLALYNFFLFISIKETSYLWYSIYTLSIVIMFISINLDSPSHLQEIVFPNNAKIPFFIRQIFTNFTWIAYGQFARVYLNTKKQLPVFDKLILLTMGLDIVGFMLILNGIISKTIFIHFFIVTICLCSGIILYKRGYKIAKFFIVAQVFVVLGLLIVSGYWLKIDFLLFLPHNQIGNYLRTPSTLYASGALESIFFSFALGSKYNTLQQDIARVKLEREKEKQLLLISQNETLENEVKLRTEELTKSLDTLKATQAQLIQSEKMASLGELTAGIAHEIQNPLNFINNFSSINKDVLAEIKEDTSLNLTLKAEIKPFIDQVIKNSEIINNHGNKIDAIVKGMLLHSRSGASKKEWTDINNTCEETINLAFHAFKAKVKSFSPIYELKLDPSIPKINVVKEDLNRALLNIINNSFYACAERSLGAVGLRKSEILNPEEANSPPAASNEVLTLQEEYQPKVIISTRSIPGSIEIRILDNGSGIPENIRDKIFQPFFTTKPTGQGTGLGLSLAYDTVTKGLGGRLEVRSEKGIYTEFTLSIPNA
ncbi:MAG: 7TM diverse intracellular signaling domain-containing protein [Saprospiraceae bacterium]